MKSIRNFSFLALTAIAALLLPACKAKKPVVAPPPAAAPAPAPPAEEPKPEPVKEQPAAAPAPAPEPPKPDYNFKNIQFEFNSAVLKTSAYMILDKAVLEMKKDPSARFVLNGYASAEGTAEHNMSLSAERANAVKTYLVNAGINADNMTSKGFGEANPVSENTDEAGRALNRRVEVKLSK